MFIAGTGIRNIKRQLRMLCMLQGQQGFLEFLTCQIQIPAITTLKLAEERLNLAKQANSPVFYGLYVGLTSDPDQIREAVQAWRDLFPKIGSKTGVVGLKMFAGHSVGNLGIIEEKDQKIVYKTLAEEGFDGVLAVHCEKESLLRPGLWAPSNPKSHSYARPPEAEVASIKDQIKFAQECQFKGILHIAHVSVPESMHLVEKARQDGKIKISCGLTPHHCILNNGVIPESEKGFLYKVNPPLRDKESSEKMLALLREGKINWIETDHAPHALKEKLNAPYMSGFPGLPFYPHFINFLRANNFSDEQIKNITHKNICSTFGIDLQERNINPDMELDDEYEVDTYKEIREK